MLTSNNSFSDDSRKSSGSSSMLTEMRYNINFDDKKEFEHTINDDYMNFSGKDERYWERRKKNNAAAKRSRERRRQHDMELEEQIQNLKLLNSKLQKEIIALRQKINFYDSLRDHLDISQKYAQNIEIPSLPLIPDNMSYVTNNEKNLNLTDNFTIMETLYDANGTNTTYLQDPIDLSCKLQNIQSISSVLNKGQFKTIYHSNAQAIQDQKYLDRRRRNNEAVRKCRQNKRAKIMNNIKMGTDDKDQIKIKIESISNDLEKLKSHLKHSEQLPSIQTEYLKNENSKYFGSKMMKWKSKLIEADQADKEMS